MLGEGTRRESAHCQARAGTTDAAWHFPRVRRICCESVAKPIRPIVRRCNALACKFEAVLSTRGTSSLDRTRYVCERIFLVCNLSNAPRRRRESTKNRRRSILVLETRIIAKRIENRARNLGFPLSGIRRIRGKFVSHAYCVSGISATYLAVF